MQLRTPLQKSVVQLNGGRDPPSLNSQRWGPTPSPPHSELQPSGGIPTVFQPSSIPPGLQNAGQHFEPHPSAAQETLDDIPSVRKNPAYKLPAGYVKDGEHREALVHAGLDRIRQLVSTFTSIFPTILNLGIF
jgi:hypothetical protein